MAIVWQWDEVRGEFTVLGDLSMPLLVRDAAVLLGFYASKSAADRAIKSGNLLWGRSWRECVQKVKRYDEIVPTGWPITFAVKKPYPYWRDIVIPAPGMGRHAFSRMWNEQPIRFKDDARDLIEGTMNRLHAIGRHVKAERP